MRNLWLVSGWLMSWNSTISVGQMFIKLHKYMIEFGVWFSFFSLCYLCCLQLFFLFLFLLITFRQKGWGICWLIKRTNLFLWNLIESMKIISWLSINSFPPWKMKIKMLMLMPRLRPNSCMFCICLSYMFQFFSELE